ncbi:MAG: hypothetical protein CL395_01915 [Acidiferrobacteraceae bacterium]|jgi:hypothetical protein|nr:hypothetical protein [Acidiferrobacteraceae bacterium]MCP4829710.1 YcgN family cysteine cluster protein [Pseudomonadota bacterium]HJP08192.1 YcgN family cysteine cluster protein [Arenicellales bacterium]|tara:strand:+ start:4656 stop:5051 length:396 start_codon:yes stop_codon:yes gene_type:complete
MTSPLSSLNHAAWEALCDGCGRCCVVKLEDEDTGEVHYTNVACRHLNTETCCCSDYENRSKINPSCVTLSPDDLAIIDIMPSTCAYRLIHEGRPVSLNADALSVSGKVISEEYIHEEQLSEHVVDWISTTD